ncbi:MAG: hypothetical protein HZB50_03885 [Chloroflexi bacterium]|nr:hypothetical protein [Chloroflexota bacterium]
MNTIKRIVGITSQVILIFSMVFGTFTPSVKAQAQINHSASEAPTTKNDISKGLTLGSPNSPQQAIVPILSEEIAKQAQLQAPVIQPLQINLSAEPAIYTPGKPIIIKWDLIGGTADQKANLSIVARPPNGVLPVNTKDVPNTDGSVTITPKADTGTIVWKVLSYAELPLSFTFELVSNGEILNFNSILIDQPLAETNQKLTSKIASRDAKVNISVPSNASASPLLMDIRQPDSSALHGTSLSWNPVEIIAVDKNSQKNVTKFSNPVTIQINYDEANIFGWDEQSLSIYYYDPIQSDWFPMETVVDTVNNTLTVQSDHLTVFDYKANNWQSQSLPTVDSFKVSDFTGAGTYAINLWTPPGQGRLQPSLALTYNSQVIDESYTFSQPSWVGMGWSLDTGAITRNMHGTDNVPEDDTFSISAGGVSGLLLPISVNASGNVTTYNTADQSFMKVEFDSSSSVNTWTAWSKDGTKYVFSTTAKTNSSNGCATTLDLTWRWSLTSVTDINDNTLSYTYSTETKSGGCSNQIAVYPDTITYPNNKYRVVFVQDAAVRTDYQSSWTNINSRALYGTKRLSEVDIQYNPGTWTNVKRYVLSYAPNTATTNIIYPNFVWSAGGKTSTLLSVKEYGSDGSTLPAVQFTYGDSMHLTKVNNGQGGEVQMTYARRWKYFDDLNKDLRNFKTTFGSNGDECNYSNPLTTWERVAGTGVVRCSTPKYLLVGGSGNSATAVHTIPENMLKLGSFYWFYVKVRSISGTGTHAVIRGFREVISNSETTIKPNKTVSTNVEVEFQDPLEMPVEYNPTETKIELTCNDCFFKDVQVIQMPQEYFVTQRTVTTQQNGPASTYVYNYDNASPNTKDNSAAAVKAETTSRKLYTQKLREFRGSSMSEVIDPAGLATLTWFNQTDNLKGKPYDTLVMKQNFYDSMDSINSDWVATGSTHSVTGVSQIDYDGNVESTNFRGGPTVRLRRAASTLTSGNVAIARIRLSSAGGTSGDPAEATVGLVSNGSSFRVHLDPLLGAVLLIPKYPFPQLMSGTDFKLDTWYVIMFFVDDSNGLRIRMWQANDPSVSGEVVTTMPAGKAWQFEENILNGTLSLGMYAEGTPYTETITKYESIVQYDTDDTNSIPDLAAPGLTSYTDLNIAWNRPTTTESRNYNGDSRFVGKKQVYTYTAEYGNVATVTEYSGINGSWSPYRVTQTEYSLDTSAYIVNRPASQTVTDPAHNNDRLAQTLYFYENTVNLVNYPNLITQRVWAGNWDNVEHYAQTSMTYDSYGNILTQSAYSEYGTSDSNPPVSSKQTTTTVYDTDGYNTYPTKVTNELEQSVSTIYEYSLGLPTSVTDANFATTSATYDGFGRVDTITAPGDSPATLTIKYHDDRIPFQVDLVQKVNDTAKIRLSRFYDGAGRQIQTQTVRAVVDGLLKNVVVEYKYDPTGRLEKQTVPYPIDPTVEVDEVATPDFHPQDFTKPFSSTAYDVIGRTISTTAPNQTSVNYSYGDLTTTVTDPKGNQTITTTDTRGRTTLVDAPTGPDISYQYDAFDRLTDAIRAGNTTHIDYDILGRKKNMNDPDMGSWSYTYDALGNLKSQKDAKNQYTCLYYDALNRLDGKSYSSSGCGTPVPFSVDFSYDEGVNGKGRRTSMSDTSGSTSWAYDDRGHLIHESKTIADSLSTFDTFWVYNTGGQIEKMTYPEDNEQLTYWYNTDGTLKSLTSSTGGTYMNDMHYDEAGRLKLMQYGNNIINKTFNYFAWNTVDMGGLLSSVSATSTTSLQSLSYTYDKNGNALTILDSLAAGVPQTQIFTYDALNRITSASAVGGTNGQYSESYSYDPVSGNLALKSDLTYPSSDVAYTYGDLAHVHAVTSLSNGNRYDYDANGNMIQRDIDMRTFDLAYDAENRLVQVSSHASLPPTPTPIPTASPTPTSTPTATPTEIPIPTSTPISYPPPPPIYGPASAPQTTFGQSAPASIFSQADFTYNGDGSRVKSELTTEIGTSTTYFVGNYYEVADGVVTKYYYAGSQRIAMRKNGELKYLISDHLGSTSVVTNATGGDPSYQQYKAWGETRSASDNGATKYQYTGQYSYSSDFGLMYYGARWYDPSMGRFAQADSIVPGGVQGLDRYAYVNNSPLNYVDPSGHSECNTQEDCADSGTTPYGFRKVPSWWYPIDSDPNKLTEDGENARWIYDQYGGDLDSMLTELQYRELAGWYDNPQAYPLFKQIPQHRFLDWAGIYCSSATFNCLMNWVGDYYQSLDSIYTVLKSGDSPEDITNKHKSDDNYLLRLSRAAEIVNNMKYSSTSFLNGNMGYDIEILRASEVQHPVIGLGPNQHGYISDRYRFPCSGGETDVYSVISTYDQYLYRIHHPYKKC